MDVKKKIVIALPGRTYSNRFLLAWSDLLNKLSNSNYNIMITNEYSSFVPFTRMKTLGLDVQKGPNQQPFDGNFDVWVTIDSDIIFTYENFVELVESTNIHPVVSGLYKMENIVNFACVKEWDPESFIKYGQFKFLNESDLKNMDRFESVAYNGLGFFAVRREVFEKLKYPFFYRPLEEIKDKKGNVVIVEMCSEDVAFCRNITDQGYEIMVNKNIILGHEKTFAV